MSYKGFIEKNVTYIMGRPYLFLKVYICGSVIAYLDDIINNLEILPYLLHFSEVLKKKDKKSENYQIFCGVTYVTGCYSLTLTLSAG